MFLHSNAFSIRPKVIFQMSMTYYNLKWEGAIGSLLETITEENQPLEQAKEKGITYRRSDLEWFQYYGALYLRYLQIYRDIEDCYDQVVHPQRRLLMKQMLDNAIVRMCEVKQNLIRYSTQTNIVQSDYLNIDNILVDLKLTPKALEVPLPRHFTNKNKERDSVISDIVRELGVSEEVQVMTDTVALDTDIDTTLRIIQKLERGRQGIVRWMALAKSRNKSSKDRSPDANNQEDVRTNVIQKYWRAFLQREELNRLRQEELRFLGIQKDPIAKSLLEIAQKQRCQLKFIQKSREEQFEKQKGTIYEQIKKTEEPSLKQKMLDDRRQWIKKFLEMHQFSNVPTKSADYYKDKNTPVEQTGDKDKKEKKDKEKKEEPKGKGKKNQVEKFLDQHIAIGPTESVVKLEENMKEYESTWASRDESQSFDQIYDVDLARDTLRPGVESELEKIVDSIINLELDGMRVKYGIKKKKEKKPKKKGKGAKKVKIPQGLGKKNPRELLEQLYEKNIAKMLTPAKFKEFLGEHNTVTHLVEKTAEFLPDPSLFQVRNLVAEYVGIPLGSQNAKDKLQKWNWFLFYGAIGTGKTMLVRALQTETNAILFDLTPESVKERYSEKAELTKLLWSVIICAKEYQPSIILIDDIETVFAGAKKKKDGNGPSFGGKMKKVLADMRKNKLWSKNDRISVIGCTNKPSDGSLKEMQKIFDKKIYFPYPNYATRKLLIQEFINGKLPSPITNFSFETLAHATEGFTAGSFKQCIDRVMNPMRIARLKDEPLRMCEFINPLASATCVFSDEYEKLRKFTDEVTGLRERREAKKEPVLEEKKKEKKK